MAATSLIGTTVGQYRFLDRLGEGGMGEVYLVEHVALGWREALKVLRPELAQAAEFVRRFRREARASHRVQHPGIVSVFDFGQLPGGRFYLAMEYVPGDRLDLLIERAGKLTAARALPLLAQIAEAAAHAHQHGVVHRDLKPGNVIVSERDGRREARVLDFGIAKIIAPEYQESGVLTLQGEVFGSPSYMAPEQWRAKPAAPAMDIYSIGCLGYELLTGAPPFRGKRMELMHRHLTQAPEPPSRLAPGVTSALDALILGCLAKDPAQRPRAAELAAELRRLSAAPVDFEHAEPTDTQAGGGAEAVPESGSDTERQGPVARRLALRELVEAVLDRTGDRAVTVALARVHEVEAELGRLEQRLRALDGESGELEQAAREREDALRFAVTELAFERDGLPADARGDIQTDIAALEHKLGEVARRLEADLGAIGDRQVTAAAARAEREEELEAAYAALARDALRAAARLPDDLALADLAARVTEG